ncbi:TlyA family RNA methyltransferase [Tuberibacillus sp. Marseille-P3662]|uniref:TlyA family RNA methyltransferase n=1 Tax=Tuberibacillus sp. Marseille-P3662 TaxID=1965358 RepID=UPI000A1CB903|nr:TlyA family RNA methyltransferase [Tuberibacillus sp. Marseille-P3662]
MKERIDVILVNQGYFDSREQAKRAVMAGLVFSGSERIDKPGSKIDANTLLRVKGQSIPYVGRGGLKLEKALDVFDLTVKDHRMLDIGSSTGGFTDCALQNGAALVYALDVGYNQLAWKLRQDERVVVMERTNFRYSTPDDFICGTPSRATIDVSFISLKMIFPVLDAILTPDGEGIALIKPQFEAGRDEVGKKGIVRDPGVHLDVIKDIVTFMKETGFSVLSLDSSPVTGGDGNIEFLCHFKRHGQEDAEIVPSEADIRHIVEKAHQRLKQR